MPAAALESGALLHRDTDTLVYRQTHVSPSLSLLWILMTPALAQLLHLRLFECQISI